MCKQGAANTRHGSFTPACNANTSRFCSWQISEDRLAGWREETTAECATQWFPGGHFYFSSKGEAYVHCGCQTTMPRLPLHILGWLVDR